MKYLIFCMALSFSATTHAQKSDCKITVTTDDFNGKTVIASRNFNIIEKYHLGEALLGVKDKSPWYLSLGFHSAGVPQLFVRHISEGYEERSGVESLDIKFDDGTVFTFDKPIEGVYKKKTLAEGSYQSTYFNLTKTQLEKFASAILAKSRVKFVNNPNDHTAEKTLNKLKAEKISKEAKCFLEAISAAAKR